MYKVAPSSLLDLFLKQKTWTQVAEQDQITQPHTKKPAPHREHDGQLDS